MKRKMHSLGVAFAIMVCAFWVGAAESGDVKTQEQVRGAVGAALSEKTRLGGTLDLYDEKLEKVRNLRMIKEEQNITGEGTVYFSVIEFRDVNSGDTVEVEAEAVQEGDGFIVKDFRVKNVRPIQAEGAPAAKEYSDEEIQGFMQEYLTRQTQFNDGRLMLFDKEAEKMRNLTLIKMDKEVRRLGIMYSSPAQFKDVDSGEILNIDIAVENKNGRLNTQGLRIRDVRKGPVE